MGFDLAQAAVFAAGFAVMLALMRTAAPKAAAALMAGKNRKMTAWWESCAEEYAAFKEQNGREPQKKPGSDEGALALWRDDVRRVGALGNLTREKAEKAVAAGALAPEALEACCANPVAKREPKVGWAETIVAAASYGALCTGSVTAAGLPLCILAWAAGGAAVLAACVAWPCDTAQRIIPFECSGTALLCGAAYQLAIGGTGALFLACALALIAWAAFSLTCWADRKLNGRTSVGKGDVRFAPAAMMCCGAYGATVGFAAAAAAFAATLAADKRRDPDGPPAMKRMLPMGPALTCWAVVGMGLAPFAEAALLAL